MRLHLFISLSLVTSAATRALKCAVYFTLTALLCGQATAQQVAPKLLPFQGRLTDQSGIAVTNGTRFVQFKIYAVSTGGSPVWAGEVHKTTVNGGLVNVLLGSKTPFTGVDFDQTLYLEITADINGDGAITLADPPMLPRQVILPAVFAKESADSRLLAGADWTPLFGVNNPNGSLLSSKIATNSINGSQITSNSITGAQIQPGTITASQIAFNTISESNLTAVFVQFLKTLDPPGTINAFGGSAAPDGWLLCDGRALNSALYPKLYAAISTNWGGGYEWNGSAWIKGTNDFNVPDLRGMFLRGMTGTQTNQFVDPDVASRTNQVVGGNSGNAVGSVQLDMFAEHNHATPPYNILPRVNGLATMGSSDNVGWELNNTDFGTIQPAGGHETRPKNAYVNYIIKY